MKLRPVEPETPFDPEKLARVMFWQGYTVTQISEITGSARSTVQSWKDRGKWDEATPLDQVEQVTSARYIQLVMKNEKTGSDYKEIDLLGRQMTQFAKIRRYEAPGGHEGDLNDKVENRNAKPKKKARKNLIDRETAEKLVEAFGPNLFQHQINWRNSTGLSTRMLLKSRQIGATYYFARERFMWAMETGNSQAFISASRAQANLFRQYIFDFVYRTTGVELKGDPIIVERGDDEDGNPLEPFTLRFLGTNYRTAQSYASDVIIDEYAWIHGFQEIYDVASGMASHKRFSVTLFSTPSTIAHESYQMWTGETFNRDRTKGERVKIDVSHAALKDGVMGPDGIFRQIITLQDAIDLGFDEIDVERQRLRYSVDRFNNLYNCEFVDDSQSSFPLSLIRPCMVDSWEVWKDYQPYAIKPYAGEVWLGYDPQESENGDNAALVAVAAPKDNKGKFRLLEKIQFKGKDYEEQAAEIKRLKAKYHVTEIAIDTTGMGNSVYKMVLKFHPTARRIDYSPVVKGEMVLKAQNVFRNRRIEMDLGWTDMAAALMSIHPEITKGGRQITYVARRSADTGHGDLGWALLHVLWCEPLDISETSQKSRVRVLS